MKMVKGMLVIAIAFSTVATAWSQCKEIKWPEDKVKAEEAVAIWGDAIKQQHYRAATAPLQWMMNKAPQWNTKLYVDATEVYDKLATKETDASKKQALIDSLMIIYDLRIKNCGDEVNVLNRKAFSNLKFNIQNKGKAAEVLTLFDKVYEISGTKVIDSNLDGYMTAIYGNWAQLKNLTDDQILSRYDKLMSVVDAKIKIAHDANKTAEVEKLKGIKAGIDEKLTKMVPVTCDFVKKSMEPRFKQNPSDIELAKKMFFFMTKDGCIEDPLWLQVAERIHADSPDYGLAVNMAKVYAKKGITDKAEVLAQEAATLAGTQAQKVEALILHGDLLASRGNKSGARESYRKAIVADPSSKEGFEKIGDLYMGSFSECSKKVSLAEDRLVYIAAYEMYARSGNQQKMSQAKSQFPSVTELFELNWKEGETKKIECWVGETVTLKTRGKE